MTFGRLSSLERVSLCCFEGTGVEDVVLPNGLHELCEETAVEERTHSFPLHGEEDALEAGEDVVFPNGVRVLCDCCFKWFSGLRCVPSGSPSQGGLAVRAFIQAPVCQNLPGIYNDDLCFSSLPISMSKLYSELLDILSLNIQEGCTEE